MPNKQANPVSLTFPPGRKIFSEGDEGGSVYIVEAGKVEIARLQDGHKVVLNVIGPGAVFGEMALISQTARMATATALEQTSVIVVPRHVLERQMEKSDPFIRKLVFGLIEYLRALSDMYLAKDKGGKGGA